MSHEYLTIGNKRLEYCWVGPSNSEKPVLVFLHEGLGCIQLWRDFPQAICQKLGMRGFIYSRAGYGNSSPCELPRSISYMHDEAIDVLPQVLDKAGIENAILVGHSDGGSIALIYGGTCTTSRVKAIITLAAHVFSERQVYSAFVSARSSYQAGDLRARLQKYHGSNVDNAFWGWLNVWMTPEFESWNLEEFLPAIDLPAKIIQGVNDEYGTVSQVKAIIKGIGPNAASHMIPDCGHSPHLQQRAKTMEVICDFVKGLEQ